MKIIAIGDLHGRDCWKEFLNQDFDEAEFEGNVTENLSYQCQNCNDTGRVIGFSGHSVPCRYCNMHDLLLSQQQVQPDSSTNSLT